MTDWLEELAPDERSQWDEFVDHFRRDALEKIAGSGIFLSIVPSKEDFDVKFAAELGTMMFFDKPLIVVTAPGQDIPPKIRRIADFVVAADIDTGEGRAALADALRSFAARRS